MSEHTIPLRVYYGVFAALMVMLVATVVIAFLPLGPVGPAAAFTIATVKALLVVLYFMHVRYSSRLTWLFAGAGVLWLMILFALTLSDYLSRPWQPVTPW